jgi:uncharacterized protein YozE (UPF0346 family)
MVAKKKTHKEFIDEIFKLFNTEYDILSEYINNSTKIKIKHNKCNYIWDILPTNILKCARCPKCAGLIPYTTESFKEKLFELVENEYSLLGEYKNARTDILIKHNICDYTYCVKPYNFISKYRCPKCSKRIHNKTTEYFKQEIFNLVGEEYEVLGEYKGANVKINIKHNFCNNIYVSTPHIFFNGSRCTFCAESKGERKIRYYLQENNIIFEKQYIFDDCKRFEVLPFDFAVLNNNGNLNFLIEYDGEFHYKPMVGMGQLEYQKENDQLKNNYCEQNDINLLRIPYWDFDNIEKILDNALY